MRHRTAWLLALVATACSDDGAGGDGGNGPGSTGAADSATTDLPVTSVDPGATSLASTSSADTATDGTTDPSGAFIEDPDFGSACTTFECDLYAQDCCPGQQCVPWANDGGESFNATRCVEILTDGDRQGQPCTVEDSPVSGLDSCGPGLICWGVDAQTLMGTCAPTCTGTVEAPECADDLICVSDQTPSDDDTIAVCLPSCDPLADDCAVGSCTKADDAFACSGVPATAGLGDACDVLFDCGPGTQCVAANVLPDCPGPNGCCAAWCDLTADNPHAKCPAGTACVSWYPGAPPAEYAHVGICVEFG